MEPGGYLKASPSLDARVRQTVLWAGLCIIYKHRWIKHCSPQHPTEGGRRDSWPVSASYSSHIHMPQPITGMESSHHNNSLKTPYTLHHTTHTFQLFCHKSQASACVHFWKLLKALAGVLTLSTIMLNWHRRNMEEKGLGVLLLGSVRSLRQEGNMWAITNKYVIGQSCYGSCFHRLIQNGIESIFKAFLNLLDYSLQTFSLQKFVTTTPAKCKSFQCELVWWNSAVRTWSF